ncbi:MAG: S9 family peptidase [Gemmatimonadota bacterium]|nr:MAG: S9 family peptidase [Gemmatimonadota bacterium]
MNAITRSLLALCLTTILPVVSGFAQEPYHQPAPDVVAIVDAPPTPSVNISPDGAWMALADQRAYPSIAQLSQPTLGLAGIRFNPRTNGDDQPPPVTAIRLLRLDDGQERQIDLPEDAQLTYPFWSPDSRHLAFTNTTDAGVELWVASVDSEHARRLTGPQLMAARGAPCRWLAGSEALLCQLIPADRGPAPEPPRAPGGPTIQEAEGGQQAPVRTYQNLLTSPFDEVLFEYYFTAQLTRIDLSGERELIGEPAIFNQIDGAPDGLHVLVSRVQRPYSYLVPVYSFPQEVEVWGHAGSEVHHIASLPLAENVPIGGVPKGPRSIDWLPGQGHSLFWLEALDGGDPKAEVDHRDRLVRLDPPFAGEPLELARTELRTYSVRWSDDGELALAWTWDRPTENTKTVLVDATKPGAQHKVLWDMNRQDAYSDPGDAVLTLTERGEYVLLRSPDESSIYLAGAGASPEGDHPFLDRYDLATGETQRLWLAQDPYYEWPIEVLDAEAKQLVTRRESKSAPPNYFVRDLSDGTTRAITQIGDPAPQLTGIEKKRIRYSRADGVDLTGTLYLPPDYVEGTRLPTVIWAYPFEFKSADAAGQVRGSENRFTFYRGYSHLFFLTQGYAVLDAASMPVIGEGDEEPNDSFVDQLVMNARAAIDALVELGVTDPNRVGVGGHSYGAFMTANLLAHSDLFRAGIARSGAYNRSLTPFGFQNERRTFWEAPEIYFAMSPFMHADSIDEPILLLHGEADTNSGTFPIQSQRLYHAVKGMGGTIKLVMYPHEQHGYRARETVLDALYQQFDWFDRFVKNAGSKNARATSATDASAGH